MSIKIPKYRIRNHVCWRIWSSFYSPPSSLHHYFTCGGTCLQWIDKMAAVRSSTTTRRGKGRVRTHTSFVLVVRRAQVVVWEDDDAREPLFAAALLASCMAAVVLVDCPPTRPPLLIIIVHFTTNQRRPFARSFGRLVGRSR